MKQITKDQFVAILDGAGITDAQKRKLHALFEQKHPEAHQGFLAYLGVAPTDIEKIRSHSREG